MCDFFSLIKPLNKLTGYTTSVLREYFRSESINSMQLSHFHELELQIRENYIVDLDVEYVIQIIIDELFAVNLDRIIVISKLFFSDADEEDIILYLMILELMNEGIVYSFPIKLHNEL